MLNTYFRLSKRLEVIGMVWFSVINVVKLNRELLQALHVTRLTVSAFARFGPNQNDQSEIE